MELLALRWTFVPSGKSKISFSPFLVLSVLISAVCELPVSDDDVPVPFKTKSDIAIMETAAATFSQVVRWNMRGF
jgi:hypothetical protein